MFSVPGKSGPLWPSPLVTVCSNLCEVEKDTGLFAGSNTIQEHHFICGVQLHAAVKLNKSVKCVYRFDEMKLFGHASSMSIGQSVCCSV